MYEVAIMGFGTVGSGVWEIIQEHGFKNKIGEEIKVSKILDIRDFKGHEAEELFTKEFEEIKNNKNIVVVAEAMGGLHPAYEFTRELLMSGKSVVTSNKELVATYGPELLKLAKDNDVNYLFEASVGGGIPIIRPMSSCLLSNDIERIAGILNGTTNYILTQMFENSKSFDEALKNAQELGYAERNPAADVEGYDACRKIAILSSLAWGKYVDYNDIPTEGITKISSEDVKYAEKLDSVIKLIGYSECDENGEILVMVRPMLINKKSPLASVSDVFNAVLVTGDSLGDAMFYGRGAGKEATASAVVADIIDCVKHIGKEKHNINWDAPAKDIMRDNQKAKAEYFVRVNNNKDEVLKYFDKAKIIDNSDGVVFVTPEIQQSELEVKLEKLGGSLSVIRILEA